jgi:integrase
LGRFFYCEFLLISARTSAIRRSDRRDHAAHARGAVEGITMVLDHGRVEPNPARDKLTVRMPREERRELNPPTAEHVRAVHALLPSRYRLPLLVLDATGMRIGELEALTWGDVDEPRQRWRVSGAVPKTGRARWVPVPHELFEAVMRLVRKRSRARRARLPGLRRRPLPDGDHARLHRGRRADLLAARPPSPPRLAAAPGRDAVGADRRACRSR